MLETHGVAVDDDLLRDWHARIERARASLGWEPSLPIVARRHAGGASLALAAPLDQLFTATEVNEWAWCAAVHEREGSAWTGLEVALQQAALEQAGDDTSNVILPTLDESAALGRFVALARRERRPNLVGLVTAARAHDVSVVLDDDQFTLGTGRSSRTWPLDALPALNDVAWAELGNVPVAVVTGSNGKTTTVRLIAACARAHGWQAGYSCTDGVFVGGERVASGDYSGPAGTRRIVRDRRVEAAVLETARGGVLRRGLALESAAVAIVTNVSNDHFGEYGIDDLAGLTDVKLVVAKVVAPRGVLVVNADDTGLRERVDMLAATLEPLPQLAWFALDDAHPTLSSHRERGGTTCGVHAKRLRLTLRGEVHNLGDVDAMPLSVHGTATYNVANLAAAALGALGLGIAPVTIADVFAEFARNPDDNAGRLMRFTQGGTEYIVDYAHNPDGLRGVLHVARALRGPQGRLLMLLGHAGNRRDEDIAELARVAASFGPDLVLVKEDEAHLRGRAPGEVPAILRRALLESGVVNAAIRVLGSELEAAHAAIAAARPGDAVALLIHSSAARASVLELLRSRAAAVS